MDIHPDILSAVGSTPLVRLSRLHPPGNLLAKVEFVNPGGSVKDRIAASMIDQAVAAGLLEPGGTIVEATSGNTGAALAMLAAVRGYHLVAVMADKQSKEKQEAELRISRFLRFNKNPPLKDLKEKRLKRK